MFFRKLNNSQLWEKIKKLRELVQETDNFKDRKCYACEKSLNIYDFLSDNLEFAPEHVLDLWQSPFLEFHCCECFKYLKFHELEAIEELVKARECAFCDNTIDLFKFGKDHSYLKIHELKEEWLNLLKPIFCDNLCQRKYYKEKAESSTNNSL
ncbi:MAG: hypothetical protein JW891_03590 [Candidatus Lokiarchaeota archaeon]|nr:hypothetical protein [Candidatus Lokiarchaeota archaeon]